MKVKAEVKKIYKLHVCNNSSCMGQYYLEDDWDIILYGETLDELRSDAAYAFVNRKININHASLVKINCLHYDDHIFDLDIEKELPNEDTWAFVDSVYSSAIYKKLKKQQEEAEKRAKEKRKKEEEEKSLRRRLEMYKRLKEEFEDVL